MKFPIFFGFALIFIPLANAEVAASKKLDRYTIDPNKSANQMTDLDLGLVGPAFPHPAFSHILPQIEKLAVCNGTVASIDLDYKKIDILLDICKQKRADVAKLLPTVHGKVRVSDFETYYRMIFWNHVGYLKGFASAQERSVKSVAQDLADDIINSGM
jgi:hypothetical protein